MIRSVVTIDSQPVESLSAATLLDWQRICCEQAEFAGPYYRPEFSQGVARVRRGVHVGLIREHGELAAVFPYERDAAGRGRAVASRLSDFHCIIGRLKQPPTPRELLHDCQLKSFQFDHWPRLQLLPGQQTRRSMTSPFLDLSQGFEHYFAKRLSIGATRLRKVGQVTRKLEREVGPVTFHHQDNDPLAWKLLLEWKSDQYRRSGALDIFRYPWVADVLRSLSQQQSPHFAATMMTLRAGSRIAAVHFGMRSGPIVHWWFPAYAPDLARYSPGLIMLIEAAKYFAANGCQRIELGKGNEPYKASLTSDYVEMTEGVLCHGGWNDRLCEKSYAWLAAARAIPGKSLFRQLSKRVHNLLDHRDFRQH